MGFLEKLGLHRKKKAYIPFTTEKLNKDKVPGLFNRNNLIKFAICVSFLALIIGLYPKSPIPEITYSIGEPWRDDDLTAPFTFSLLKSDSEFQEEIREIQENTAPIFLVEPRVSTQVNETLNLNFNELGRVIEAWIEWQESRRVGSELAEADSLRFFRLRNQADIGLDDSDWETLTGQHASTYTDDNTGVLIYPFVEVQLNNALETILEELFRDGMIDISKGELSAGEIIIRNLQERTEREVPLQNVRTIREARDYTRTQLTRQFDDEIVRVATRLVNHVLEPNLRYSEEDSQDLIQERIDAISPTKGAVSSGQMIIRHGDIITAERYNMLQSLARARAERASESEIWTHYIGEALLVLAVFLIFFFYLYLYRRKIFDNNSMLLLVFLTIGLIYSVGAFIARLDGISHYIVPFAVTPILLTIIFDSRVGLMTTTLLALLAGLMFGNSFEFVVATITACSIGVYSVRDIKDRSQFYLTTPGLIFFTYAFVLLGFTMTKVGGWDEYTSHLVYLLGNAVGIWLAYPLILLIEKTFRITTDVTLLELSNTNQPILKKLMLEAPGSFHHSLQVANLAEAGASGIGANALLCRVGALYHDIGKLEKPQYFVENQHSGNVHDKLKPRMSALIIKNHVDAGIKMAKEIELPEILIHFIRTHHGTSLIRFFYEKAMNESGNEQEIQEEDFRYDGPIPNSKETGILLLADGVEAASRSMSDHSYQKLENLVNRLVDDRLAEGQLNDCALTLKDLTIIKEVFTRILQGMYHGRVKYPGQEAQEATEAAQQDSVNAASATGQIPDTETEGYAGKSSNSGIKAEPDPDSNPAFGEGDVSGSEHGSGTTREDGQGK